MLSRFLRLPVLLLVSLPVLAQPSQVLVTVAERAITADDLSQAMGSSPFGDQFATLDEDDQARLRGDMLRRLVQAELLHQEALARGLGQDPEFHHELDVFRTGLLYQAYLDRLAAQADPADADRAQIRAELSGEGDAIAAADALLAARHFRELKAQRLAELAQRFHLQRHAAAESVGDDAVLAQGDGFIIRRGDLRVPAESSDEAMAARLDTAVEAALFARAAEQEGVDVEGRLARYRRDALARRLLLDKRREWIPDEQAQRDYFAAHTELGYVPALWHVGQIVLASREEAEAMRQRIVDGESLFELAAEHSVDPYGREQAGDMGWLREGSGMPALEEALKGLEPGGVSEVVETSKGFHVLTLLEREPGEQRPYEAVADRVVRAMLAEHLPGFMAELAARYPVQWRLPDRAAEPR